MDENDPIADLWEQGLGSEWYAHEPLPEVPEPDPADTEPAVTEEADESQSDEPAEPLPESGDDSGIDPMQEPVPDDDGPLDSAPAIEEPAPPVKQVVVPEPVQSDGEALDAAPAVEEPPGPAEPEPVSSTSERDDYAAIEMLAPPVDEPEPFPDAPASRAASPEVQSVSATDAGEAPGEQLAYDPTGSQGSGQQQPQRFAVSVDIMNLHEAAESIVSQLAGQWDQFQSASIAGMENSLANYAYQNDRYNQS